MDKKVGVYICKGCDIGKSLDIDKLSEVSTGELKCPVCKTVDVMCTPEAVALIRADIENKGINRVVVAACSRRGFPELFEIGGDVMSYRANLRAQVV